MHDAKSLLSRQYYFLHLTNERKCGRYWSVQFDKKIKVRWLGPLISFPSVKFFNERYTKLLADQQWEGLLEFRPHLDFKNIYIYMCKKGEGLLFTTFLYATSGMWTIIYLL